MQGLFIYVLTYFVRYSMNAVNADAECRYGMLSTKLSIVRRSGCKTTTTTKSLFLLAVMNYFISEFNLFLNLYQRLYVYKCFNGHFMF